MVGRGPHKSIGEPRVWIIPSRASWPAWVVAETFIVEDFNGTKVFVKWLPTWASAQAMLRGLAVAERLRALGVPAAAPSAPSRACYRPSFKDAPSPCSSLLR